jgi:hypothetical protein
MSLKRRLAELERRHPNRPPMVILVTSGDEPPLSEEEQQALIREEMKRNPGLPLYYIVVPRPDQGQDTDS